MKIYVASSWRNLLQPAIVIALQRCGHKVYDFRNPIPDWTDEGVGSPEPGFAWSSIDPNWKNWTAPEYREALQHPLAVKGYGHDIAALKACDACVLVLPSGRSASWEFGYAMGQGKQGTVVQLDEIEPELMYREAAIVTSMHELFDAFALPGSGLEKGVSGTGRRFEDPSLPLGMGKPQQAEASVAGGVVTFKNNTKEPRVMTAFVEGDLREVAPNCKACASCYLDDMDFICGHKDAGSWGKKIGVASDADGHCGPTLKKFVQHPLRTPSGGLK